MCELLGMECNVPTDIVFSFSGLAMRGGHKGPHADGWGLALYDGHAVRMFLEPTAAAHSTLARFVKENPIKTLLAVAHVRKKTRGKTSLANTHPFVRELWGRAFTFAHNGTVKKVRRFPLGKFQPIGETDSEYAFCVLLAAIERALPHFPKTPRERSRFYEIVAEAASRIGESGTFNFLLGDGTHLFGRCATKLSYIIRKAPFRVATLRDDDVVVDFSSVTTPRDRVAIVATEPLTRDEEWTIGTPGTLWVFQQGRLRRTLSS